VQRDPGRQCQFGDNGIEYSIITPVFDLTAGMGDCRMIAMKVPADGDERDAKRDMSDIHRRLPRLRDLDRTPRRRSDLFDGDIECIGGEQNRDPAALISLGGKP
jgi:hypothetical protein